MPPLGVTESKTLDAVKLTKDAKSPPPPEADSNHSSEAPCVLASEEEEEEEVNSSESESNASAESERESDEDGKNNDTEEEKEEDEDDEDDDNDNDDEEEEEEEEEDNDDEEDPSLQMENSDLQDGLRVARLLEATDGEENISDTLSSVSSKSSIFEKKNKCQSAILPSEHSMEESSAPVSQEARGLPLTFLSDPVTAASAVLVHSICLEDTLSEADSSSGEREKKRSSHCKTKIKTISADDCASSTDAGNSRTGNEALSLECANWFRDFALQKPSASPLDLASSSSDIQELNAALDEATDLSKRLTEKREDEAEEDQEDDEDEEEDNDDEEEDNDDAEEDNDDEDDEDDERRSAKTSKDEEEKRGASTKRHFQKLEISSPACHSQGWASLLWKEASETGRLPPRRDFKSCKDEPLKVAAATFPPKASQGKGGLCKEELKAGRERRDDLTERREASPRSLRVEDVYERVAARCEAFALATLLNRPPHSDASSDSETSSSPSSPSSPSSSSSCSSSSSSSSSASRSRSSTPQKRTSKERRRSFSLVSSDDSSASDSASDSTESSDESVDASSGAEESRHCRSRSSQNSTDSSASSSCEASEDEASSESEEKVPRLGRSRSVSSSNASSRPPSQEALQRRPSSAKEPKPNSLVPSRSSVQLQVPGAKRQPDLQGRRQGRLSSAASSSSLHPSNPSCFSFRRKASQPLLSGTTRGSSSQTLSGSVGATLSSCRLLKNRPRSAAAISSSVLSSSRMQTNAASSSISRRGRLSAQEQRMLKEMLPPFAPQELNKGARASFASRPQSPQAQSHQTSSLNNKHLSASSGVRSRLVEQEIHRRQLRSVKMSGVRQRLKRFAAAHGDAHALCMQQFRRSMSVPDQIPVFCVERSKGQRAEGELLEMQKGLELATLESCLVNALRRRGWVRNEDSRSSYFDFKWRLRDSEDDYATLRPQQLFNHFQGHEAITTKGGLASSLRSLRCTDGAPVPFFFPRCYDLSVLSDCTAFLLDFCRCEAATVLLLYLEQTREADGNRSLSQSPSSKEDFRPSTAPFERSRVEAKNQMQPATQSSEACGGRSVCRMCAEDSRAFSTEAVVLLWLAMQLLQAWLRELDPDAFLDIRGEDAFAPRVSAFDEEARTSVGRRGSGGLSPSHVEAFVEYAWIRRVHPEGFLSQWSRARRRARTQDAKSSIAELATPLKTRRSAPSTSLVTALLRRVKSRWSLWRADLGNWASQVLERAEEEPDDSAPRPSNSDEKEMRQTPTQNIWVVKPSNNARASGIKLFSNPLDILRTGRGLRNRLVQRYVERPLLLFGKKFDLRLWVFVRSFSPLKAFLFSEPYLRLCAERYDVSDLGNRFKHLCNWSVNKQHSAVRRRQAVEADFSPGESIAKSAEASPDEASALPLPFLKALLRRRTGNSRYWEDILLPQLRFVVLQVLRAAQPLVVSRPSSFEVYGFDVLLDDCLRPWVLEANLSPSCSARAFWMKRLLSDMTTQILDLLLGPPDSQQQTQVDAADAALTRKKEPAKKQQTPRETGRWELLFDESVDAKEAVDTFPRVLSPFESAPPLTEDTADLTPTDASQNCDGRSSTEKFIKNESERADAPTARNAWIDAASREAAEKLFGALYEFGSAHKDKKTNAGKRLHWQRLVIQGRGAASANKFN